MLGRFRDFVVDLYNREPARSNAAIVAAVVAIGGAVGVAVSAPAVLAVVVVLAPFVVAELTRPKVTPDAKITDVPRGESVVVSGPAGIAPPT